MKTTHKNGKYRKGGYMLLFASLVSSILLAIALGVYTLGLKELVLASFAKNSELAIAAADRGLECALYWDSGYPQNGRKYTAFATSSAGPGRYEGAGVFPEPGGVFCQTGSGPLDVSAIPWSKSNGSNTRYQTDYSYEFSNGTCVKVTVFKEWTGVVERSTITSRGFNMNCHEARATSTTPHPRLVQRVLEVKLEF